MAVTTPPCTHPAVPISVVGTAPARGISPQRPYATFKIDVDAQGNVTGAALEDSTGVSAIDDAAAKAVRQWRFVPASSNCRAIASTVEYAVPIGDKYVYSDPCEHGVAVRNQAQPEYPDAARGVVRKETQAWTRVDLDGAGRVIGLSTVQSSGNAALDEAAMRAAAFSTYAPAVHECQPVAGYYVFKVTFDPNS